MIRKLQIKLTAVTLLSLTVVLTIIFGMASMFSYYTIVKTADEILDLLSEYGGSFSIGIAGGPSLYRDRGWSFYDSEEIPYESRYFSVVVDTDGTVRSLDLVQIASVTEEEAKAYAAAVYGSGKKRGFEDSYRFLAYEEAGSVHILFLDCGRLLYSHFTNVVSTLAMALICIIIVAVITAALSRRIIHPIIESYEKQRQFVTDAGHEIKTPLTIINADADLLAMDLGDDNEWLKDIQAQTKRLTELTNSLIMLSRLQETGEKSLDIAEFSISEAAGEAARSFQSLAMTKNKRLNISLEKDLVMRGNRKSIQQLISLLLDNAVKYAPEGSDITLSLKKEGKYIVLSTQNQASGLSKKDLEHMFDRFYRADKSRNSGTGGYGIGLSIAHAIVDSHHGRIHAEGNDSGILTIKASFPSV